jgi:hypothetical protein
VKANNKAKQRAFLAAFETCASITKAAKAATMDRALHYDWLITDPEYLGRFEAAKTRAGEVLEDEAVRRAHDGVLEPLVYQGQFQYKTRDKQIQREDGTVEIVQEQHGKPLAIRKYSDGLLQFLLRGFKPEKYRDRGQVELTGANGGPIDSAITLTFVRPKE